MTDTTLPALLAEDPVATAVARGGTDGLPVAAAHDWSVTADPHFTSFAGLPGRDLDKRELLTLASSVAARPDLWQQHVAFDDDKRHYVSLYRDAHVDVWVLCWTPVNDTGWHDHDISSGAVAVTQGTLTEHNLAVDRPSLATEVPAGQVYCFGPDHIHRLTGRDAGSVSIHAYSPPLWRMGQYAVGATGVLRRTSVSYADELRPLDDMI
ncbi:cysteine dioxygenase family protein [Jatrophihabitans telluris]|uniref:Cysteine dioxygenase family protein n=1 Tax=Jatrophihabitans telluris TaxID=2038343 RepID=A0ABY4R123_9ACTN|nr:cysteine dioxygenase family protein [Jatrophihabitans telluris]UQX88749.1 cysteine dioxygenase family protein [Jatrophihabitans telluris]